MGEGSILKGKIAPPGENSILKEHSFLPPPPPSPSPFFEELPYPENKQAFVYKLVYNDFRKSDRGRLLG